jgi:uncharacterized membrane protein (DUF485 family)
MACSANGACVLGCFFSFALLVAYCTNFVAACIALSESSVEPVVFACGDGVRTVVLLHAIYVFIIWVPNYLFEVFRKEYESDTRFWRCGVVVVCSVSALSVSAGMSFTVARHALEDGNCTAALSEGSRFQTPMLAHLCYACFALDLLALLSICWSVLENWEFMCTEEHRVYTVCYVVEALLWSLLVIGLVVNLFVNIVALDLSSGPLVEAACGTGLWNMVLGQLIAFHVGPLLFWGVYSVFTNCDFTNECNLVAAVVGAVVMWVASGVGAYYSFAYARDARDNANCTAALSAVNSMGAPMLERVAWSHFGVNLLFLLVEVIWFVVYMCQQDFGHGWFARMFCCK